MLRNRILILSALTAAVLAAQAVDRTKAPQTPPIPNYKLPPVFETKLPNGLAIQVVEDARFPIVTVDLSFHGGSKLDPADRPGLASAVAALLTEGTKTRTSQQLSEQTDGLGGSIGGAAGPDSLTVSGSALSENLGKLLELMADVSRNATFPQDEVDLYKQNSTQELLQNRSQPAYLASEKYAQVVFGSSPYAHIGPTAASIQKLDGKALAGYRDAYLAPNNATLILIGKLPARAELVKTITQYFGAWQQKALPPAPKMELPPSHRQIVLVDRPGSVQADIHAGRLAPIRTSPDFFPLVAGNAILGGGANSRMFRDIRERDGFAYDAHSEFVTNREAASLTAVTEVRNDVLEPALKAVLAELDQMATTRVSPEELTNIKNYKAGLFLLSLETQQGVISQLATVVSLGLPKDFLETYTTHIRSVEPDQVLAAAKKYMAPGEDAIVVVGDAAKIGETLKKFGTVTIAKMD